MVRKPQYGIANKMLYNIVHLKYVNDLMIITIVPDSDPDSNPDSADLTSCCIRVIKYW